MRALHQMERPVESSGIVTQIEDLRGRRHRWRRRSLMGFATIGILTTSIWALGFNTSTSSAGTSATATAITGTPGDTSTSTDGVTNGLITTPETLAVGWAGKWGVLAADYSVFRLDLDTDVQFAAEDDFTVTIEVTDVPLPNVWEAIQFEWVRKAGTCDSNTSFATVDDTAVAGIAFVEDMAVFEEVPGNAVHCFGVKAVAKASDSTKTFLRRPSTTVVPSVIEFGLSAWEV